MLNTGQILKIQSSTESLEGDLFICRTIYELQKSGIPDKSGKVSCLAYRFLVQRGVHEVIEDRGVLAVLVYVLPDGLAL